MPPFANVGATFYWGPGANCPLPLPPPSGRPWLQVRMISTLTYVFTRCLSPTGSAIYCMHVAWNTLDWEKIIILYVVWCLYFHDRKTAFSIIAFSKISSKWILFKMLKNELFSKPHVNNIFCVQCIDQSKTFLMCLLHQWRTTFRRFTAPCLHRLALFSIQQTDLTSFSEDGRGVKWLCN